jgi:hypothetical protein
LLEIDPGVKTIVIGKSDILQPMLACAFDPRLQERLRVRLHTMRLRVSVVVGEQIQRES